MNQIQKYIPLVTDLIEEKVHNRFIYALNILMLYIAIVFILVASLAEPEQPPDHIQIVTDMQSKYSFAQPVENFSPSPRIKLASRDEGKKISNSYTQLQIMDFLADISEGLPDCDMQKRKAMIGTLEYLRLLEVCRPVLLNKRQFSYGQSVTVFKNVLLDRGPEGLYGFQFVAEEVAVDVDQTNTQVGDAGSKTLTSSSKVKSQEFYVQFESDVSRIEVQNGLNGEINWFPNFVPGQPLNPQPIIRLLDSFGHPVKGKRVVALSWPEPQFRKFGVDYNVNAIKFAWMSGDVSEPSNEAGIATFTSLTVIGSVSDSFYLFIICDNAISQLWGDFSSSALDMLYIPYYKRPLVLDPLFIQQYQITIELLSGYSTTVEEGKTFSQPCRVFIKDRASNSPKTHVLVFAFLSGTVRAGEVIQFPMGFRYKNQNRAERLKELIRPIPGSYSTSSDDPITSETVLVPLLTDQNGMVEFTQLAFSQYGAAGSFIIGFSALSEQAYTSQIKVQSSVRQVRLVNQADFPTIVNIDSQDLERMLQPILQILDENQKGVSGKMPQVTVLDSVSGVAISDEQQQLFFNQSMRNVYIQPSDDDGFIKVFMYFQFIWKNEISLQFKFSVEDISIISPAVKIISNQKNKQICGAITPLSSTLTKVKVNSSFDLTFLVLDQTGNPLNNASLYIYLENIPASTTLPPRSFIPQLNCSGCKYDSKLKMNFVLSNAMGQARFQGLKLNNTPNMQVLINTIAISSVNTSSQPTASRRLNSYILSNQLIRQQSLIKQKPSQISYRLLQTDEEGTNTDYEDLFTYDDNQQEEGTVDSNKDNGDSYTQFPEDLSPQQSPELSPDQIAQVIDQQSPVSEISPDISQTQESQLLEQAGDQEAMIENSDSGQQIEETYSSSSIKKSFAYMKEPYRLVADSDLYLIDSSHTCNQQSNPLTCTLNLTFIDFYLQPLSDQSLHLKILINQIPFYLSSMYLPYLQDSKADQSQYYKKFFTITAPSQFDNSNGQTCITDASGVCALQLQFKDFLYGQVQFTIATLGIYSPIITITRSFPEPVSLTIQQQPISNILNQTATQQHRTIAQTTQTTTSTNREFQSQYCDLAKAVIVGDAIEMNTPFIIKVIGNITGSSLANVPVIAQVYAEDNSEIDQVLLDLSDIQRSATTSQGNTQTFKSPVVLGQWRISLTDNNGLAVFKYLSLIDSRGCHCVRFIFSVEAYINGSSQTTQQKTDPTYMFCFRQQITAELISQSAYSKIIQPNQPFKSPIKLSLQGLKSFNLQHNIFYVFNFTFAAALLFEIDGAPAKNPVGQADQYSDNYLCYQLKIFDPHDISLQSLSTASQSLGTLVTIPNGCILSFKNNINEATFSFASFVWRGQSISNIRLTFSTLLNYNQVKDVQFPSQKFMKNWPDIAKLSQDLTEKLAYLNKTIPSPLQSALTFASNLQAKLQQLLSNLSSPSSFEDVIMLKSQIQSQYALISNSIKTIFSGIRSSAETTLISIQQETRSIQIMDQPPQVNYLKDLIPVTVLCLNVGGLPVNNAPILVSVTQTPEQTTNVEGNDLKSLINELGKSKMDINTIHSMLKKSNNVVLDPTRIYFKTKITGKAVINTKILEGQPGVYTMTFQSQGVKSKPTIKFLLINNIVNVSFSQIQVPVISHTSFQISTLSAEPIVIAGIYLHLAYNQSTNSLSNGSNRSLKNDKKHVRIKVFKYISPTEIEKQMAQIQQNFSSQNTNNWMKAYKNAANNDNFTDFSQILKQFKDVLVSAGNVYQFMKNADLQLQYKIEGQFEDDNGELLLSNVTIYFQKYGEYYIQVSVDGIDSPQSSVISVQPPTITSAIQQKDIQYVIDFLFIGLFIIIFFLINTDSQSKRGDKHSSLMKSVYQNNSYISLMYKILLTLGIFLIIADIVYVFLEVDFVGNQLNFIYRLVNLFFYLFVVCFLVFNQIKQKSFSDIKRTLQYEYTFQKLFNRPSTEKLKKCIRYAALKQQNKSNYHNQVNESQIYGASEGESSVTAQLMEYYQLEKSLFKQQSPLSKLVPLRQHIKAVFIPARFYHDRFICMEGFYFLPQRIFASIFISAFSLIYIFIKVVQIAVGLQDSIMEVFMSTKISFNEFIATANRNVGESQVLSSLKEQHIQSAYNYIDVAEDALLGYLMGLNVALILAAVICLLCYFASSMSVLLDFRQRVLSMRSGIYGEDIKKCQVVNSQFQYIGFHVSNEILAFLFMFIVFSLFFSILFWKNLWILLWEFRATILTIFVSKIIVMIENKIRQMLTINYYLTKVIEIFLIYLNIVSGVFSAIKRIIKAICISLFCLFVVDKGLYAGWILRIAFADSVTKQYLAIVYLYHISNNPIANVFREILLQKMNNNKQCEENINQPQNRVNKSGIDSQENIKLDRVGINNKQFQENSKFGQIPLISKKQIIFRNRFWLYLFMVKNPHIKLYQMRKVNMKSENQPKEPEKIKQYIIQIKNIAKIFFINQKIVLTQFHVMATIKWNGVKRIKQK